MDKKNMNLSKPMEEAILSLGNVYVKGNTCHALVRRGLVVYANVHRHILTGEGWKLYWRIRERQEANG